MGYWEEKMRYEEEERSRDFQRNAFKDFTLKWVIKTSNPKRCINFFFRELIKTFEEFVVLDAKIIRQEKPNLIVLRIKKENGDIMRYTHKLEIIKGKFVFILNVKLENWLKYFINREMINMVNKGHTKILNQIEKKFNQQEKR